MNRSSVDFLFGLFFFSFFSKSAFSRNQRRGFFSGKYEGQFVRMRKPRRLCSPKRGQYDPCVSGGKLRLMRSRDVRNVGGDSQCMVMYIFFSKSKNAECRRAYQRGTRALSPNERDSRREGEIRHSSKRMRGEKGDPLPSPFSSTSLSRRFSLSHFLAEPAIGEMLRRHHRRNGGGRR